MLAYAFGKRLQQAFRAATAKAGHAEEVPRGDHCAVRVRHGGGARARRPAQPPRDERAQRRTQGRSVHRHAGAARRAIARLNSSTAFVCSKTAA